MKLVSNISAGVGRWWHASIVAVGKRAAVDNWECVALRPELERLLWQKWRVLVRPGSTTAVLLPDGRLCLELDLQEHQR